MLRRKKKQKEEKQNKTKGKTGSRLFNDMFLLEGGDGAMVK